VTINTFEEDLYAESKSRWLENVLAWPQVSRRGALSDLMEEAPRHRW
jgi:hypothetical protein